MVEELPLHLLDDGTHEPAVRRMRDHERVDDAHDLGHVENDDVLALLVVGGAGRDPRSFSARRAFQFGHGILCGSTKGTDVDVERGGAGELSHARRVPKCAASSPEIAANPKAAT